MGNNGKKVDVSLLNWAQWHAAFDMCACGTGWLETNDIVRCAQVLPRSSWLQTDEVHHVHRPQTHCVTGVFVSTPIMASQCMKCAQVAMSAPLQGRQASLGLLYDRIARDAWSEKAASGLPFDLTAAAATVDTTILRLAQVEHDRLAKVRFLCSCHAAARALCMQANINVQPGKGATGKGGASGTMPHEQQRALDLTFVQVARAARAAKGAKAAKVTRVARQATTMLAKACVPDALVHIYARAECRVRQRQPPAELRSLSVPS